MADADVEALYSDQPQKSASPTGTIDPEVAAAYKGSSYMLNPSRYVSRESDPGLVPQTPVGTLVGKYNQLAGDAYTDVAKRFGVTDPQSLQDIRNAPAAFETIYGGQAISGAKSLIKSMRAPPGVEPEVHPLQEAADAEQARLAKMDEVFKSQGIELPDKNVSPTQGVANRMAREDLGLPRDAPLTPQMLREGNKQYVSPAYDAVAKIPEPIKLSDATKATIEDVRPLLPTKEASTLPAGDAITGQQAVDLSKALRARANQLDGLQGVNANNQLWSDVANAHRDAAVAIENDVREHLTARGQGQLADAWDAARIYRAKSGAYEHALDGAQNVRVPDLKRQMINGRPVSDNMEILANMGAQHPELFRNTPAARRPGIMRRIVGRSVPALSAAGGAAVGGMVGFPSTGAVIGEGLGSGLEGKILPP